MSVCRCLGGRDVCFDMSQCDKYLYYYLSTEDFLTSIYPIKHEGIISPFEYDAVGNFSNVDANYYLTLKAQFSLSDSKYHLHFEDDEISSKQKLSSCNEGVILCLDTKNLYRYWKLKQYEFSIYENKDYAFMINDNMTYDGKNMEVRVSLGGKELCDIDHDVPLKQIVLPQNLRFKKNKEAILMLLQGLYILKDDTLSIINESQWEF